MRGLAFFAEKVINNSYLSLDGSVKDFFSIESDSEWQKAKKDAHNPEKINEKGSNGYAKWLKEVEAYNLPNNTEALLSEVSLHLVALAKNYQNFILGAKQLMARSLAFGNEVKSFKGSLEACLIEYKKSDETASQAPELVSAMEKSIKSFSEWSQILSCEPDISEVLLLEVFKYQLAEVEELKSLLRRREAFMSIYTKNVNLQSKKEQLQQSYRTAGKTDKADAMQAEIENCKKEREKSKYVVDFMTKALFFLELDLFHKARLHNFKKMFGEYASTQYLFSQKLADMWNQFSLECKFTQSAIGSASTKNLSEIKNLLSLPLPGN
eukprot:g2335.t1